ncbi:to MFS phosphate transporter [Geosmithia morbida]|uniref:To MFS phosphate transporter n=1 Tax=Geosmithia morbida TaxID=1094350 RepID=A0A9P5D1D3_9HYPO|nr:to MFS phosphate transporter [Geosmithia morbida]KAF4122627.1 to MFS phosphate transporter [Geosmithia morbida]
MSDLDEKNSTGPGAGDPVTPPPPAHHHHHDPIPGEIPIPHGPVPDSSDADGDDGDDGVIAGTTQHERRIFGHVTRPDDSYTPEGVYWADLPLLSRFGFVSKVDRAAAAQELGTVGSMMRKDPLSPVGWYLRNAVIPGAGLGLEGYVLFSIGNLEPLFALVWPACWSDNTVCSKNWVAAVTYLEIIGIIWGLTLEGWVICYAWSLFFYSVGVGGEYPITATSSLENSVAAGRLSTREDRLHRGRRVTMAFLMQGWGQFVNQVMLIVLLVIFNSGSSQAPFSKLAAQFTFRLSFAFPAVGTLWLVYYRTWRMPDASRQLAEAKSRTNVTGYDVTALRYCFTYFGPRLLATAGAWFCNDVFFYGNKLFQGQFIKVVSDSPGLMTTWTWNLVNIVVSLAGYYAAALLIDNKLYGRRTMMQVGFFFCFLMFVIPAFDYDHYTSPAGVHAFQAMYFLSSFFNQFGPNSVTFLVAAEVFPTPIRATAHGFSACVGKAGALLASILYNYIDDRTKFHVVPWFGLVGMLLTFLFLPDTTGLDLKEQERRWTYIRAGRDHDYHGVAVHPSHLSLWERLRGVGRHYDPQADWRSRIDDMRAEWERVQSELGPKERESHVGGLHPATDADGNTTTAGTAALPDDGEFSPEIHQYFLRSSPMHTTTNKTKGTPDP